MNTVGPLRFVKMHGVGNHFVVVDARNQAPRDWPVLAPALCRYRKGVGADGLLVIAESERHDARMRMFNPDGSEDFCGNGMRCVARLVANERDAVLVVDTLAGPRECRVRYDGSGGCAVDVDMGEPSFDPRDVPTMLNSVTEYVLPVNGREFRATTISTGTAHTILFVEELPDDPMFYLFGPLIEHHPFFPERTSVMWTKVEGPHLLAMRIWERGVGETWGCGSGACAAAVAAIRQGLAESPVTVESRGGKLLLEWSPGERIRMIGPAEVVFEGSFMLPEVP